MEIYKDTVKLVLRVNGEKRTVTVRPADTLLRVLREQLGLTGTKIGCENGDCGACTVLINGLPYKSCLLLAIEAVQSEIMTIEGLMQIPLKKEFMKRGGFQCGYCSSGFIMNCYSLITLCPHADEEMIEEWLQSNICRCTNYKEIKEVVKNEMVKMISDF